MTGRAAFAGGARACGVRSLWERPREVSYLKPGRNSETHMVAPGCFALGFDVSYLCWRRSLTCPVRLLLAWNPGHDTVGKALEYGEGVEGFHR